MSDVAYTFNVHMRGREIAADVRAIPSSLSPLDSFVALHIGGVDFFADTAAALLPIADAIHAAIAKEQLTKEQAA